MSAMTKQERIPVHVVSMIIFVEFLTTYILLSLYFAYKHLPNKPSVNGGILIGFKVNLKVLLHSLSI